MAEKTHKKEQPPYQVEAVVRACGILKAFHSEHDRPRLQELADRVGLSHSTTLRLLRTLESCGFVARTPGLRYQRLYGNVLSHSHRVGYVVDTAGKSFRQEVSSGLEFAAAEFGIELLRFDAPGDRRGAMRAADAMIRHKVDLVIDFQTGYEQGPLVATKYHEAGIPMIAVDIPHPGATYFGVNNYIAGRDGGRWLAGWIRNNWESRLDAVALIGTTDGGVVSSRVKGAIAGLRDRLKPSTSFRVIELGGSSLFEPSFRLVQGLLQRIRRGRILILEPADPGVMGGLTALEETGSGSEAVVFGFGGNLETRIALRYRGSKLIGCVGFCPETYGRQLALTAARLLEGKPVPPAVFVEHRVISRDNVDLLYPNDETRVAPAMDSGESSSSTWLASQRGA